MANVNVNSLFIISRDELMQFVGSRFTGTMQGEDVGDIGGLLECYDPDFARAFDLNCHQFTNTKSTG